MKLRLYGVLTLAATIGLLLQSTGTSAQDKKEEGKDVVVNAELINADLKDKVKTDCYCKTYTFKMTEGKTYTIEMRSAAAGFDSYLRLEDEDGKQVAEDDDSGASQTNPLDARIVFRAPKTADFQIICTTFGPQTGKFTLSVKDTTK
jgi:hypothetical protein